MGTDIHGWVEVRQASPNTLPPDDAVWKGIIKIDNVITGNYDMFSCLFGVTPDTPFLPIAANRGLPTRLSEEARADYMGWDVVFGETWVAWSEIAAVNWSEDAVDSSPHLYERNEVGELVYVGKSASLTSSNIEEGHNWQVGTTLYRVERMTRQEAVSSDWALLFRLMQTLANEYGDETVRLVVWFDR